MGFKESLEKGDILVADGAMGTLLQAAGLPSGMIPEEWNLIEPAKVEAVHRAYVEAGAGIILTNTFGGNRVKLSRARREGDIERFNRAASEAARRAAGTDVFVAGDLGPTGELLEPLGSMTAKQVQEAYAEQAGILASAGVDLILIESMSDLAEVRAALTGAQEATDLPVVVSMTFETHLRTMMGVTPEAMMKELWPLGPAALGANCGKSLDENLTVIGRLHQAIPDAPLWAKPNAGLPKLVDGVTSYDLGADQFAEYVLRFVDAGARVIGGCCGSTPAHIRAAVDTLAAWKSDS